MGKFKNNLKRYIPKKLWYYYQLIKAVKESLYDLKMRVKDKVYDTSESERVKRDLTLSYHIIEKGLTMPVPRPGFGKKVVISLVNSILKFENLHLPTNELEFRQAVSTLKEYDEFHKSINFELDSDVNEKLNLVVQKFNDVEGIQQIHTNRKEYFCKIYKSFDEFCYSRYSVRNYTDEEVPIEVFYECIDMAQKSPSFCNRQPSRIYIIKTPEKKNGILELQNGNRGFGHLADTLLVITSLISTTKDIHERNENHLNGGMFSMTLLNALHFKKIGACSLNWSVSKDKDLKLRQLLDIPNNEVVLLVISCGYVPDEFAVASSPRKSAQDITKIQ